MNKYKEKIGDILNKVKKNKRILYLTFCTVLILFCLTLNVTFSYFNKTKNINGANITIGDLKYQMIINEVELNESVGTKLPSNTIIGDRIIKLKAGKTEQFEVNLISQNSIDTKYEIIYKVCTDEYCTKFMDSNPSSINISYYFETPDIYGIVKAGKLKSVKLVSDNESDIDYYVQIDLNVGYIHNELALTNQISNNFTPGSLEGNLSIIAYVDGVEVETFPTEPNYETGITCSYKDGSVSTARGVFKYVAGKGWVVDVFELDRSLTTCRVDFTEVLKVTYEVLSKRYDCANLEAASKPSDPVIKYTGNCSVLSDTENTDGTHTWRMKLLTSGTLTVNGLIYIDAFLVGGGGGGGHGGGSISDTNYGGPGGGGGYTKTQKNIRLDNKTGNYSITIGSGGAASSNGGTTSAFTYSISGGNGSATLKAGGTGGSGGGGLSGNKNAGGAGGSDGGSGSAGTCGAYCSYGGSGQGSTTREFGETTGELYAGGGGGGGGVSGAGGAGGGGAGGNWNNGVGSSGTANTGGGGGGAGSVNQYGGASGGSGVVVIRDVRS